MCNGAGLRDGGTYHTLVSTGVEIGLYSLPHANQVECSREHSCLKHAQEKACSQEPCVVLHEPLKHRN